MIISYLRYEIYKIKKNKFKDGRKELQTQVSKHQNGLQLFLPISLLHSLLHLKIKSKATKKP